MTPPLREGRFSLNRGGGFYAVLVRLRLARGDGHDIRRQSLALVLFTWAPLVIAAAVQSRLGVPASPVLHDPSVHVRFLVGLPLLVWAEHDLDERSAGALDDFAEGSFAPEPGALQNILRSAVRLRDSRWVELALLTLPLVVAQLLTWKGDGPSGALSSSAEPAALPRVWYGLIALPVFQFVLGRALWHWLIWSRLLWQLSRLRLRLMPTHPDLAGGLGRLSLPVASFAIMGLAGSAVIASTWGGHVVSGRVASLQSFAVPLTAFVIIVELAACGPLLFFMKHLVRARIEGLRRYGALALRYTLEFHAKWIAPEQGTAEPLLGSQDLQALADLSNSFQVVESMRVVPFNPRMLSFVLIAALLPMLPLVLTVMSLPQILTVLGRALLGAG